MITSAAEILSPPESATGGYPYLAQGIETDSIYLVQGRGDSPGWERCVCLVSNGGAPPVGMPTIQRLARLKRIRGSVKFIMHSD